MTSTPNGRLYIFGNVGDQPSLVYSLLGEKSLKFGQPQPINYLAVKLDRTTIAVPAGRDAAYSALVNVYTNGISRLSYDDKSSRVRLSYPFLDDSGRTAIAIVDAEIIEESQAPYVQNVAIVKAVDAKSSILASSFIDPDAKTSRQIKSHRAVFYYQEGVNAGDGKARVRFRISDDSKMFLSQPLALSNGTARTWNPTWSLGHYMYGGAFVHEGKLKFLAQWSEVDGIHGNIVTLDAPPAPKAKFSFDCKADGTPDEFPNDLRVFNKGPDAVPAGTEIRWLLPSRRRSGYKKLDASLAPKAFITLTDVLASGVEAGTPCRAVYVSLLK
jgi:hypothetical protein